jgi:hypothetical protein
MVQELIVAERRSGWRSRVQAGCGPDIRPSFLSTNLTNRTNGSRQGWREQPLASWSS